MISDTHSVRPSTTMFKAKKFLADQFGEPVDVAAALHARFPKAPSADTVRKWYIRDSVSSEWLPPLLVLIEERQGQPTSVKAYVTSGRRQ